MCVCVACGVVCVCVCVRVCVCVCVCVHTRRDPTRVHEQHRRLDRMGCAWVATEGIGGGAGSLCAACGTHHPVSTACIVAVPWVVYQPFRWPGEC